MLRSHSKPSLQLTRPHQHHTKRSLSLTWQNKSRRKLPSKTGDVFPELGICPPKWGAFSQSWEIMLQNGRRFPKVRDSSPKVGDVSSRLRIYAPEWETFSQGWGIMLHFGGQKKTRFSRSSHLTWGNCMRFFIQSDVYLKVCQSSECPINSTGEFFELPVEPCTLYLTFHIQNPRCL